MKILLTGGAGFIGSHTAEALLARGDSLIVVDNFNDFYDPRIKRRNLQAVSRVGDFRTVEADILDRELMDRVFEEERPERVIHLAAYAGVRPSLERPALYTEVNVTATVHLLELACKWRVSHFVFGSSSSVYGINSKVPFSETDPVQKPISPYAATKRAGELMGFVYHQNRGIPVTCLRFFTVYGPRQRPEMAIQKFTRLIDQGEEIPVYHEGRSERDYTYFADIVEGVLAALDRPEGFEIYNLGNSRTVPLLDLIGLIEKNLGKEARIRLMPAQPGDVPITFADITLAAERLGYSPSTQIEGGIANFVDWYREQPRG